jgi:Gas vesicle protein
VTDPMAGRSLTGYGRAPPPARRPESANLADILERVLDKGIVIAGDIQVNLLDIELLTIKLRLVIASVDRAKEMGIDWWEHDPTLSSAARQREIAEENRRLRERIAALEAAEEEAGLEGRERRAVDRPDERRDRRERFRPREEDDRRD